MLRMGGGGGEGSRINTVL